MKQAVLSQESKRALRVDSDQYFEISQRDAINYPGIKQSIDNKGFAIVKVLYPDEQAETMLDITSTIGLVQLHDQAGQIIWDVKVGGSSGQQNQARSHRQVAFPMHTDCSFETPTPDYIGLYVVRADRLGGGDSALANGAEIIAALSETSLETLMNTPVKIKIPQEFYKGIDHIEAPILNEHGEFRYRREIIDLSNATPALLAAFDELESLLNANHIRQHTFLEDGMMLLLDNRRWLHARTLIHDPKRHLKRIRFYKK